MNWIRENALKVYPNTGTKEEYVTELCNQAHSYIVNNKYEKAIEMANMAIELDPASEFAISLKSYAIIALNYQSYSVKEKNSYHFSCI